MFLPPKIVRFSCLLFALILSASGCGQEEAEKTAATQAVVESTEVENAIVKVNGSPITSEQLDLAIHRTLGDTAALYMNEELSKKILESLISSRAIAQLALKDMSDDEKKELELKAEAYKEELLVKYYLEKNVSPEPVTNEMVQEYYRLNPEKFGGDTVKHFEYIQFTLDKKDSLENAKTAMKSMANEKDWKAAAASAEQSWKPQYKKAEMSVVQLMEPLRGILTGLSAGETSSVDVQGSVLTIVRLNKETSIPGKALSEVSSDIRKSLAPLQLKKAVKGISNKARDGAEVEYINE